MILAFAISVAMNFTAYFFSDKIALKMYRAQPVTREQLPRAYEVVERLTQRQGLPMPKIYVHAHRIAQRLRHRPQSQARIGRRDPRNPRPAQR